MSAYEGSTTRAPQWTPAAREHPRLRRTRLAFGQGLPGIGLAVAVLALPSVACADPVHLILAEASSEPVQAITEAWVKPFNAEHPDIQVQALGIGLGGKLETMIAAGAAPDLAIVPEASDLSRLVPSHVLIDLRPYMSASHISKDTFYPGLVATGDPNHPDTSPIYGLPVGPWFARGLLYDEKLLDEYGIAAPQTGITWEQLAQIGQKVARGAGSGRIWAFHFPYNIWGNIEDWGFGQGLWPYRRRGPGGQPDMPLGSHDAWLRFLDYIYTTTFREKLAFCVGCEVDVGYPDTFLHAKEAFLPQETDMMDRVMAADEAGNVGFDWNLTTYPTWEAADGNSGPTHSRTIAILNSAHVKAAWMFVDYVLSREGQLSEVQNFGLSPVRSLDYVETWLAKDPRRAHLNWQALGLWNIPPYPPDYWIPNGRSEVRVMADKAILDMEENGVSPGQTLSSIRQQGSALLDTTDRQ